MSSPKGRLAEAAIERLAEWCQENDFSLVCALGFDDGSNHHTVAIVEGDNDLVRRARAKLRVETAGNGRKRRTQGHEPPTRFTVKEAPFG